MICLNPCYRLDNIRVVKCDHEFPNLQYSVLPKMAYLYCHALMHAQASCVAANCDDVLVSQLCTGSLWLMAGQPHSTPSLRYTVIA